MYTVIYASGSYTACYGLYPHAKEAKKEVRNHSGQKRVSYYKPGKDGWFIVKFNSDSFFVTAAECSR